MADFTAQFQNFRAFPLPDMDQSMGLMNLFKELNPTISVENNLLAFSGETCFPQQFPGFPENFSANFNPTDLIPLPVDHHVDDDALFEFKKRKNMSESSSENSSTPEFHTPKSLRKGKRAKGIGKSQQKQKDVVHVRARRGQATDSHSLAERVRRGKINERLRCLQDIVPGCYKSMGMAVMLDEIINYVQSLQNQVEFLSMKLTTASTFYDFNSESDAIDEMQRAKAYGATEGLRVAMNDGNASPWPF